MIATRVAQISPRDEGRIVLSSISLALIGVTLVEILVTWVSHSSLPMPRRVFFVENNVWLFAPVGLCVTLFCAPLKARGMTSAAAALVLLVLIVQNFRGMWVWQGTFDRFDTSSSRWILPLAIGAVAGFLLWILPAVRVMRNIHSSSLWMMILLALATVAAFIWGDAYVMGSAWPPTRFIALAIVLVLNLLVGAVGLDR